jgi:hypothetical protein
MGWQRALKRRGKRRRLDDEELVKPRTVNRDSDRVGLTLLQQQVGNRAVQRMLTQREAEDKEKTARAPVELGEIKIERPKVEYYDVTGSSVSEISGQLLPPGQWYEVEYHQTPRLEHGVVKQVDVEAAITIRLPRWTGPGWEHATDLDKMAWLEMLQSVEVDPEAEYEDVTTLPKKWLLGPAWEKTPDTVKGEWRAMLQAVQTQEKSPLDIIRRRAMVLQQRLINQPEKQVKAIADQFTKDLKTEQELYNRQMEFGRENKIALNASNMIQ